MGKFHFDTLLLFIAHVGKDMHSFQSSILNTWAHKHTRRAQIYRISTIFVLFIMRAYCACIGRHFSFSSWVHRTYTQCAVYMYVLYILLEAVLGSRWMCLISYNTNQSLSLALPALRSLLLSFSHLHSASPLPSSLSLCFTHPSLQVLPLIALPQLFSPLLLLSSHLLCSPSELFLSCSLPTALSVFLSLSFLSHFLYLPLYNWWEAGVVFSVYLFISSLLFGCLGVELARA